MNKYTITVTETPGVGFEVTRKNEGFTPVELQQILIHALSEVTSHIAGKKIEVIRVNRISTDVENRSRLLEMDIPPIDMTHKFPATDEQPPTTSPSYIELKAKAKELGLDFKHNISKIDLIDLINNS